MKIIKFNNYLEIVLFIIMVVLFLVPFEVNNNASLVFENVIGKILVAIIILCLFTFNPLLGLMSVLLAFKLFNLYNNDGMIKDYIPSKKKRDKVLKKYNDFPLTLEENVIGVQRILDIGQAVQSSNLFNIRYQIHLNDLFDLSASSYVPYVTAMRHVESLEE